MFKISWRGLAVALFACLLTDASKAEDAAIGIGATSTRAIVVDAQGRSLGRLIGPNQLLISYPDGEALLVFDADGYSPGKSPGSDAPEELLFETSDCSGRGYTSQLAGLGLALFRRSTEARVPGYTPSGAVFYPTREVTTRRIRSTKPASVIGGGPCTRVEFPAQSVHPVNYRNVLSFQLPLSIAVRRN